MGTIGIGQLAGLIGVSPSTIRSWEREGLISPARSAGRHRRYSPEDVGRVRELRAWVDRGYGPAALRDLLASGQAPDDGRLGGRLRLARLQKGLSLREVAVAARVSSSYLSLIERGRARPSPVLLGRVAAACGVSLDRLAVGSEVPALARKLVRAADHELTPAFVRVMMENLVEYPHAQMGMDLFEIAPGGGSGGQYSHAGEELIYVLEGELDIWLGERERYRLETGDTLYFPSAERHRWRNPGSTIARVLWANTPPTN